MNINNIIAYFLIIIIISILCPKLTKNSSFFLISLIVIGYNITRNLPVSVAVSLFITYILVLLNNKSSLITENFKSKSKKSKGKKGKKGKEKKRKKKKVVEEEEEGEEESEEEGEEHTLDSKESFLQNYKSLSHAQSKGLNKDTRDLIKTQRSLIDTLNTMGPTLKEGRHVLDTFKNYFGKEGMDLKI